MPYTDVPAVALKSYFDFTEIASNHTGNPI